MTSNTNRTVFNPADFESAGSFVTLEYLQNNYPTRTIVNSEIASCLPKAGGTVTGDLTTSGVLDANGGLETAAVEANTTAAGILTIGGDHDKTTTVNLGQAGFNQVAVQGEFHIPNSVYVECYDIYRVNSITNKNCVNGGMTTNVNKNSASFTGVFMYGAISEVAFDTGDVKGSVSPNWASNKALTINSAAMGFLSIQQGAPANGDYITWTSPSNFGSGSFIIEYMIIAGNLRPIVDVQFKADGAASFSPLRTGLDLYTTNDGVNLMMKEYVTLSTSTNTLTLKWLANGKNASSTNYFIQLGNLRITSNN